MSEPNGVHWTAYMYKALMGVWPDWGTPKPEGKWKVRKYRKAKTVSIWDVYRPDGTWDGSFESFPEALKWATDPFERMAHWLDKVGGAK